MKKRSLFAAVAMLIVSAMVLTSATYAWFNVGGDAKIIEQKGTVMTAGSGVRLKTDSGMDWNATLLPQDFWNYPTGVNNNNILVQHWTATPVANSSPTTYTYTQDSSTDGNPDAFYKPMSSADGVNFLMYNIKGDTSFALASDNSNSRNFRDSYEFHVATVIDETTGTNVQGTFKLYGPSSGSAAAAARAVIFISQDNGANWSPYTGNGSSTIVYSAGTETAATNAVTSVVDEGDDKIVDNGTGTNVKWIMNSTDTGYTANAGCFTSVTPVDASGGVTITIPGVRDTDNSRTMVKTVIWIEGQDSDCAPSLGGKVVNSSWTFTVPTT